VRRLRGWPVWGLPPAARLLVIAVPVAYLCAMAVAIDHGVFSWRAVAIAGCFAVATALSIEVSMRLAWPRARADRLSRDCLCVWILPVALLLPPAYVALMVVVPCLYVQARVWRAPLMKLVYSTAGLGLGYLAASEVHALIAGSSGPWTVTQFIVGPRAQAALLVAVLVWWVGHNILMCAIVGLTAGLQPLRAFVHDTESHIVDLAAACIGIVFAVLVTISPDVAALLIPAVLLMQHHQYSGLRQAVRRDALTNLASAQYWRQMAGREIDRATTSRTHAALLLIDVDHFKTVNDKHGHLAGDDVLAAVAAAIIAALRPGDQVGRLGGDEFAAILTGLNLHDARAAAERVRAHVEHVRVRSDNGNWISVTVSIGVAELTTCGGGLQTLTTAADLALYDAKATGRNTVRVAHRAASGDRSLRPDTDQPPAAPTIPFQEHHDSQRTTR